MSVNFNVAFRQMLNYWHDDVWILSQGIAFFVCGSVMMIKYICLVIIYDSALFCLFTLCLTVTYKIHMITKYTWCSIFNLICKKCLNIWKAKALFFSAGLQPKCLYVLDVCILRLSHSLADSVYVFASYPKHYQLSIALYNFPDTLFKPDSK